MKKFASIILGILFLVLSFLHFYWAIGGDWAFSKVLPTTIAGEPLLAPTVMDSIIVGLALLIFSIFYCIKSTIIAIKLPNWLTTILSWGVPLIFSIRAIGDFKYIGFFKEIDTTTFGQLDTSFFSPLCLFIAVTGFIVAKK